LENFIAAQNSNLQAGSNREWFSFDACERVGCQDRLAKLRASVLIGRMRLHVGAEDGIDASLISALLPEPGQQVGIPMTAFKIGNELPGED
jgi:hypothetical protein